MRYLEARFGECPIDELRSARAVTFAEVEMAQREKRIVHITWEEADRAEVERAKARQAKCLSLPRSRTEAITARVSRKLSKLKAAAPYLRDVGQNYRTWSSRFVYAVFRKRAVHAKMDAPILHAKNPFPERHFKRAPTKAANAVFAGSMLLLCVAAVFYFSRSKNSVFHPVVNGVTIVQKEPNISDAGRKTAEGPNRQPVEHQLASTSHASTQPDDLEDTGKAQDELRYFRVVDNSFVRDEPQANATIIATLRPGARISVEGKTDEYLRIRSLSDADFIGYVHEQDAFFQAIK